MSTRCTIALKSQHATAAVYVHSDGYPQGVRDTLKAAMAYAWELPRFEADEFAAAICAADKVALKEILDSSPYVNPRTAGGGVRVIRKASDIGDSAYDYRIRGVMGAPQIECRYGGERKLQWKMPLTDFMDLPDAAFDGHDLLPDWDQRAKSESLQDLADAGQIELVHVA